MTRKPNPARSDNPLLAKIDELRVAVKGRQLSRGAVGERAGLSRETLRQLGLRGPEASLATPSIVSIANVLGVAPSTLLSVAPKSGAEIDAPTARKGDMIPVLGKAAGAVVGALALGDAIDRVERPPALQHVIGAYAVYISGDSMRPMHCPGDLRFINPHKPYRTGDSVIVQTSGPNGDIFGWIKIYEHQNAEWLICRQLNPEGEYKFKATNVVDIHRVMTTGELFNK